MPLWLHAICAGGGVIETSTVTISPYVISYVAHDALGNTAVPVARFVYVYNPCLPEAYCATTGKVYGRALAALPLIVLLVLSFPICFALAALLWLPCSCCLALSAVIWLFCLCRHVLAAQPCLSWPVTYASVITSLPCP